MNTTKYQIGHTAYSGSNAYALHETYARALADLLSRKVPMRHAQRALQNAIRGSHATCSTYTKSTSGKWFANNTVEVVARKY